MPMELESNINPTREGNTSFFKTVFNHLNANIGVGLLSVSYALALGGWLSLILLLAIAAVACYAGLLTTRCMEANPTIETYSDIGKHAFGKFGQKVISIILYVDLYLVLTGYLILEGDNLHSLFPGMRVDAFGKTIGGKQTFVLIIAVLLLPTVWLDDLSVLAYISATGVIACVIILGSVLGVGVFDDVGFNHKGELFNLKGIPAIIGLYMFCFSANPVFPTLYTSMQKKEHFSKVLLIGFSCATIYYTSMAILGYLMYGSGLASQITLNLPTHKLSSKIAIYTTWITPLSKYALMFEPVAATTESWFPKNNKKRLFRMLIRTALVATQVIVALSIPFFGALMSLVGALLSVTASITIPCLCYLRIYSMRRRSVEGVFVMVLVVISMLVAALGTYSSLVTIVKQSVKHYSH